MPAQEEFPDHPGPCQVSRPRAEGKFLFLDGEKIFIKGVTYGPFGPVGREFREPEQVERDFRLMRLNGINSIRTYTVPPRWLLDAAQRHGLWVMVGLAWEQHVAFLEDPTPARRILARVRGQVNRVRGHPAILAYAVGNEIPAPIVRWHGRDRVEAFLERLYREVKSQDPGGLVTYVNYPTTEYLAELPFLDFLSFNVYLEEENDLRAYVARLQNLAGDRPLVMAELGLDAAAHGEEEQARALEWQIRSVFEGGCAGALVFSWTDEWFRGGEEITEWSFGITARDRSAKPALQAVRESFREVPFAGPRAQPLVSVVVCSYNGARTIRETLEHLSRLRYPAYEVIVVDDGSTDETAQVASEFDLRLIRTPNRGLSEARNTGLAAAKGEIVAYIDDDAYPDADWLTYLVATFEQTDHVGVGGPNLPPPDEGPTARSVARAPGGPIHVLLSDTEAEHLPGCNMAFRTERLRAIQGFDGRFRAAGDDVDVCWRLQEKGWTLGFNPAAVVWHRRRDTVKAYWKQQRGYGRAEGMLEKKWPEKYNPVGHVSWSGRLYNGPAWGLYPGVRTRIYQGTWGTAPFQSLEEGPPGPLTVAAALPESWLLVALLAGVGVLGLVWSPLLLALPLALLFAGGLVGVTVRTAWNACRGDAGLGRAARLRSLAVTSWLHLLHPLARLSGRISSGLAPWRRYVPGRVSWTLERSLAVWTEVWRAPDQWLKALEAGLRGEGLLVRRGGDYDRWDLEVRSGALGFVRLLMAIEEHGQGRQLGRIRFEPRWGAFALIAGGSGAILSLGALLEGAWLAGVALGGVTLLLSIRCLQEHAAAIARAGAVAQKLSEPDPRPESEGLRHLGPNRPPFRQPPSINGQRPVRPGALAPLPTGTFGAER